MNILFALFWYQFHIVTEVEIDMWEINTGFKLNDFWVKNKRAI